METQMKINGEAVRALREQKSWSQEHLANAAGLSVRTVQRVEVESAASAETRLALAAALGVPVADLLCEADVRQTVLAALLRIPTWGWIAASALLLVVVAMVLMSTIERIPADSLAYSTFLREVSANQVERVIFDGNVIRGQRRSGERFVTYNPEVDNRTLIATLRNSDVAIEAAPPTR
jgi:DNA-binding XRE family transcriptional regulator